MSELDDHNTVNLLITYLSGLEGRIPESAKHEAEEYGLAALPALRRLVATSPVVNGSVAELVSRLNTIAARVEDMNQFNKLIMSELEKALTPDPDPIRFQCSACNEWFRTAAEALNHEDQFKDSDELHGGWDLWRQSELDKQFDPEPIAAPDDLPTGGYTHQGTYTGKGWTWSTPSGYVETSAPQSILGTRKEDKE